jgi:TolB-like protein/Flp pilus assembly protein TadD/class 3 adenylate cyclase
MPSQHPPEVKFEIAHVLFIDIVGYSKLLISEQSEQIQKLKEIVRGTEQFRAAEAEGKLLRLPAGDGGALVFGTTPEAPVLCAIEISKELKKYPDLRVRMGIHSGPVNAITDLNEQANIAGAGINIAQRIMDCGDAGHILLSRHVAEDLEHYPRWQPYLHDLGECEVKHGVRVSIVNLYTDDAGSAALPTRLAAQKRSPAKGKQSTGFRTLLVVAAIILGLGIPALIFTPAILKSLRSSTIGDKAAPASIPEKSIAVLPFVNLSADKNDEYLSDGMTEELLNALSKVQKLRVPGRSSSFAFKGDTAQDIFRKVGEQLHVNAVLEGSVRKAGEKLRITAQLVSVADGFHLWSETYDGDMKDILAVQSDVAKRVVQALQVQLGVEEARALAKKPTENPEAHRLYLLGRYHFAKFTRAGWSNAIHYFEQALQVDPNFALAYCGLADTYGWAGGQLMPGREAWAKEVELAQKALALDPNLAEAHLSMATASFSALSPRASEKELDRAVELNPNLALAYDQYGWTFSEMGDFDKAIAAEKKALELDPLNTFLNTDLAFFLYWARRYEEATTQIRKTLELDPNNGFAHSILGWCLIWKGNKAEARAEFQKATTLDDLPWYVSSVGYASAVSGDRIKAEKILQELDEIAKQRYVSPANRAAVYLGLGEKGKALDWLEKAFEDRDPIFWWIQDQLYDSVRNEPRFQELMQKVDRIKAGAAP